MKVRDFLEFLRMTLSLYNIRNAEKLSCNVKICKQIQIWIKNTIKKIDRI